MCNWCIEHGRGKRRYHDTKNYITKELFDSKEEIQYAVAIQRHRENCRNQPEKAFPLLGKPVLGGIVGKKVKSTIEKWHHGQVVLIEGAKGILNNANMTWLSIGGLKYE